MGVVALAINTLSADLSCQFRVQEAHRDCALRIVEAVTVTRRENIVVARSKRDPIEFLS